MNTRAASATSYARTEYAPFGGRDADEVEVAIELRRVESTAVRKTKIVCTAGPACHTVEQLREVIEAGANVIRLNFSHGDHASHTETLRNVRTVAEELSRPLAILQDLCGPKIRIGELRDGGFDAKSGDRLTITTDAYLERLGEDRSSFVFDVSSTYEGLLDDVAVGNTILLDDGRVELRVEAKEAGRLITEVVRGGDVLPKKGINLPGVELSTEAVTPKDLVDLEWGIDHNVDYVALSFVRRADDLMPVLKRIDEAGSSIALVAKIERPEAVENAEAILRVADGLMVARGDLGVETGLVRVPLIQKSLIDRCRRAGKPVITATQVLESMVTDSTPTRAEVSDIANAIYDNTDAIMLSAETATGVGPAQAVSMLDCVAVATEEHIEATEGSFERRRGARTVAEALAEGAAHAADDMGAKRIVVYTRSGMTARLMAKHRPKTPVIAVTNIESTYRQLGLSYGVYPEYLPKVSNFQELLDAIDALAPERGWAKPGETLVVIAALTGLSGTTDTLHVHTLPE